MGHGSIYVDDWLEEAFATCCGVNLAVPRLLFAVAWESAVVLGLRGVNLAVCRLLFAVAWESESCSGCCGVNLGVPRLLFAVAWESAVVFGLRRVNLAVPRLIFVVAPGVAEVATWLLGLGCWFARLLVVVGPYAADLAGGVQEHDLGGFAAAHVV
jgi:hypothetical protein